MEKAYKFGFYILISLEVNEGVSIVFIVQFIKL